MGGEQRLGRFLEDRQRIARRKQRTAATPSSPSPAGAPVVVYGASGHTGRFVCQTLRHRGVPFTISGRGAESLASLAATLGDPGIRPAAVHG